MIINIRLVASCWFLSLPTTLNLTMCVYHNSSYKRQEQGTSAKQVRYGPFWGRGQLKCDGTRAETKFRLSAKRTSPFKSAKASVQPTNGSRCVCISGSNAGYIMFRGSVKSTGYTLHSPVSPSLPLPCVTVCHHISTGVYLHRQRQETTLSGT